MWKSKGDPSSADQMTDNSLIKKKTALIGMLKQFTVRFRCRLNRLPDLTTVITLNTEKCQGILCNLPKSIS